MSNWGLDGIRGHSLGYISLFFSNSKLLSLLERVVRRDRDLGRAVLSKLCHLGGDVSLGVGKVWCVDGKRVVYTLCPSKCRRSLNPSLVKGLVLYLETIVSTYLRNLSPEGLLGLCHPYIIAALCIYWMHFHLMMQQQDHMKNLMNKEIKKTVNRERGKNKSACNSW